MSCQICRPWNKPVNRETAIKKLMKRAKAQRIGSYGHALVKAEIEKSGRWIARELSEDFGIDLEMEYVTEEGAVTGKIIKVQVKAQEQVTLLDDYLYKRLDKSYLRYVYECRIPIILVLVCNARGQMWYTWLQQWIYLSNNKASIYDESNSETLEVSIHRLSTLSDHIIQGLVPIATWENDMQKLITLQDLANLALKLYDSNLSDVLFAYIDTLDTNLLKYSDALINRVLEIGSAIWATSEGNKRSQQLYDFVRRYGVKLNREHIYKLVARGEEISRTGIIALGVLYESFPSHAIGLKLPEFFADFSDPRLHYYCVLRERYIDNKGFLWVTADSDFRVGDMTIDDQDALDGLMNKMANRGDSALLDYVEFKPLTKSDKGY